MCFHTSLSKKNIQLAKRYSRKTDLIDSVKKIIDGRYHISAFTYPEYPIITTSEEIQIFRWGLIPYWTQTEKKAEEVRKMTFNAKAETLFEKPSFRSAIKTQRCLIPVTGFFDWRHEKGKKIPYYIYLKNELIFSIAGIYDYWENPQNGEIWHTFSMITTKANSLMSYIHNTNMRMPAILPFRDEEKWLDPTLTKEEIQVFLQSFDISQMEAYKIDNDFIRKSPFDRSIIQSKEKREILSEKLLCPNEPTK